MSNWFIGYIITKLTQHQGFIGYMQHLATLEHMNRLEEYRLFCKAHDEDMTIEGFETYLKYSIKGHKP